MNREAMRVFSTLTMADHTVSVKLLGDSITHGVGGTGFAQTGEPIAAWFKRNPDGYCWAKQFKEALESTFDCTVTNNACTGTPIEFILEHFDELVKPEDEVILVAIGTNNRHQYLKDAPMRDSKGQMQYVYDLIMKLYSKFVAVGKGDKVVFVANIPAMPENEKDGEDYLRLIHMTDIHNIYVKASLQCGFPLIRMYTLFMNYLEANNLELKELLFDTVHPNDRGHDVIFKLMMDELGIARKISGAEF